MKQKGTVAAPGEAVGADHAFHLAFHRALGRDAVERRDGAAVGHIVHRPHPEGAVRSHLAVVETRIRNVRLDRGDFPGDRAGVGIEQNHAIALRQNEASGARKAGAAGAALDGPFDVAGA